MNDNDRSLEMEAQESESEQERPMGDQGQPKKEDAPSSSGSGSGKHVKVDGLDLQTQPAFVRKSKRMRKVLVVVIILLVLLLAAGIFLSIQLVQTARNTAVQQSQQTAQDLQSISNTEAASDATSTTLRQTTVPNVVSLLGMNVDQAIATIQHGAQLTTLVEINEEGNPVRQEARITLTEEPSSSRNGTPTVTVGLDEAGTIITAGYSTGLASLGYGSISFTDAVANEHVVEKTLEEAGLTVSEGSAALPADKMQYSSYASDGTTLVRESWTFEGTGQAGDASHAWQAILTYDYTTANATGNLADTIRTIYVTVYA